MGNLCQKEYNWFNEKVDNIIITDQFGPLVLLHDETTLITYEQSVFEQVRDETDNFHQPIKTTAQTLDGKDINIEIHFKVVRVDNDRFMLQIEVYA